MYEKWNSFLKTVQDMLVKPEMLRGSGIYRSPFPLLTGVTMSTGNGRGWDSASGSESSDLRSGIH